MPPTSPIPTQGSPSRFPVWLVLAAIAGVVVIAVIAYRQARTSDSEDRGLNTSGSSNTNVSLNTNTPSNINTHLNINGAEVPEGWTTYDSSESELGLFQMLEPGFTVSYPANWHLSEEAGGLILGEMPRGAQGPTIEITRIKESLEGDIIESCKKHVPWTSNKPHVRYDEVRLIDVAGVRSAYLRARLPDFNGALDPVFVCVPLEDSFDLISGQPWSSNFVDGAFDAILSTLRLNP